MTTGSSGACREARRHRGRAGGACRRARWRSSTTVLGGARRAVPVAAGRGRAGADRRRADGAAVATAGGRLVYEADGGARVDGLGGGPSRALSMSGLGLVDLLGFDAERATFRSSSCHGDTRADRGRRHGAAGAGVGHRLSGAVRAAPVRFGRSGTARLTVRCSNGCRDTLTIIQRATRRHRAPGSAASDKDRAPASHRGARSAVLAARPSRDGAAHRRRPSPPRAHARRRHRVRQQRRTEARRRREPGKALTLRAQSPGSRPDCTGLEAARESAACCDG